MTGKCGRVEVTFGIRHMEYMSRRSDTHPHTEGEYEYKAGEVMQGRAGRVEV